MQTFLSGGAWPVYGDDPRSLDKQKVFSVAPLRQDGQLRGYLYIILQGETFNELAASAWQKTLWSLLLWTLLLVAGLGGWPAGLPGSGNAPGASAHRAGGNRQPGQYSCDQGAGGANSGGEPGE